MGTVLFCWSGDVFHGFADAGYLGIGRGGMWVDSML